MWKFTPADTNGTPAEFDAGNLIVATRALQTYANVLQYFTNPTYGSDMNVNGAYGGAPLLIHNGTDNVAWTMSEPVGTKWVANDATRFHSGAASMSFTNGNVGAIMQVINNVGPGNDIDLDGNYVALTMWINIESNWDAGDRFELYAHVDGGLVGNAVSLADYFDITMLDTWQYIDIPLTDLGIEASLIDAFRIENAARGGAQSPTFYLDDWNLQESGAPVIFTVEPDIGTWLHITDMRALFVDAVATDTPDVIHLSYDQILGATLTEGFLYERYQLGLSTDPLFTFRVLNLADILMAQGWEITNMGSDDTNSFLLVTQHLPVPMILKAEELDRLQVTVQDDLTAFVLFKMSVAGYEEVG